MTRAVATDRAAQNAAGSPARLDGAEKVTGRAMYAAEAPASGQLHGLLVLANIPCGEVVSIDADACRRTTGFVDWVSYAETESLVASAHTALIREPKVHFAGQPIGLVVADTLLNCVRRSACRARRVSNRRSGDHA